MRPSCARLSLTAGTLAAILCGLAGPASAQTVTGNVEGTVVDTTGAAVPGVAIVVRNSETGHTRELATNERGFYRATFLPIGRYRVTASLAGFGRVTRENIDVHLNDTAVVNLTLNPTAAEEVTVIAERPPINTTSGEIKQALTAEQIMDKPTFLAGNNNVTFLSLAETFTGFQENPTSGQNNPTASSGSSINFNGTGTRGATFQINGVNNDDSSENQNRQGAALATIKEFQVISNSYSAEFGRGFGAVVLVQTKSGTNEIHGEAYFNRQDTDMDARAFFALAKPDNQRNNYGAVLGFPLLKNKLHGFVSAERSHRTGNTNYAVDLFTAADLARPRLTRGNDTPANRTFIDSVLSRFGTLAPNDPRSIRTFSGLREIDQPLSDYSGRLDFDPTRSDHLTARYQYSRQRFDNQDRVVGEATRQNNRQQNLGITWTHLFSARTVGELRYGLGLRDTNVDIRAGNDTPIIRFAGSPVATTTIGSAGNFPIHRDQTDHQLVYNVNALLGNTHSFKAGADVRLSQLDDLADNNSRGSYNFTATCGGVAYPSSYAAFLDGCATTYTRSWGPFFLENRLKEYNVYAEDNWKVLSNLTFNLGLRYEYVGAPSEKDGRIEYALGADKNNLEPRVNFAYVPGWKSGLLSRLTGGPDNLVIRGGYGLFHGRVFQSVFSQTGASVRTNPPNAIALTFSNSLNVADPTSGFVFVPGPQTARHMETLIDPDLEMPRTHQWNLTFERKLPWKSTLRVSYSGTRGRTLRYAPGNLPVSPLDGGIVVVNHPNNAPAPGAPDLRGVRIDRIASDYQCAGTGFIPGVGVNANCPVPVPIANNEVSLRVPRTNERRPDPRFTTNLIVSNDANTWYHGLQTEWIKGFSNGLRFEMSYTFGRAIDDTSEATFVGAGDSNQLGPDKRFARGLSRFDTRHRFTLNGAWQLPILRGRKDAVGKVLGGWQLSTVVKLSSGTPFTVIDSGAGDLNFDGFSENRPVVVDPSVLGRTISDRDTSQTQLPRAAFRRSTILDFGKDIVGRNTFFGDGIRNVDLGLSKTFKMPYRHRLVTRFEAYNVFNRVRFAFPTADLASANFGSIVGQANSSRTVQLTFRYVF